MFTYVCIYPVWVTLVSWLLMGKLSGLAPTVGIDSYSLTIYRLVRLLYKHGELTFKQTGNPQSYKSKKAKKCEREGVKDIPTQRGAWAFSQVTQKDKCILHKQFRK